MHGEIQSSCAVPIHHHIVVTVILLQVIRFKLDIIVDLVSLECLPSFSDKPGTSLVDPATQHTCHQLGIWHDGDVAQVVIHFGSPGHDPRLPLNVVATPGDKGEERLTAVSIRVVELVHRETMVLEAILAENVLWS